MKPLYAFLLMLCLTSLVIAARSNRRSKRSILQSVENNAGGLHSVEKLEKGSFQYPEMGAYQPPTDFGFQYPDMGNTFPTRPLPDLGTYQPPDMGFFQPPDMGTIQYPPDIGPYQPPDMGGTFPSRPSPSYPTPLPIRCTSIYVVPFTCGEQPFLEGTSRLRIAAYSTTVKLMALMDSKISASASLNFPAATELNPGNFGVGPVSDNIDFYLAKDRSIAFDCAELFQQEFPEGTTGGKFFTYEQPIQMPYIDGHLIIRSENELRVSAIYTANPTEKMKLGRPKPGRGNQDDEDIVSMPSIDVEQFEAYRNCV